MAKLGSLARVSLVSEVQESIKELIYGHHLKPGDALPTEHKLVDMLGVSRNSIREALKVLEATGVVTIRRGYGMTVGAMSLSAMTSELVFHARLSAQEGTKELRDLMDLRAALESSLLPRVASALRQDDLDSIRIPIEAMEQAAERGQFSPEQDRLFHEQLYKPLNNPFVSQLLSAFWDVFALLQESLPESVDSPAQTAKDHRKIYEALKRGDAAGAAAALLSHFEGIKRRILDSPPSGTLTPRA